MAPPTGGRNSAGGGETVGTIARVVQVLGHVAGARGGTTVAAVADALGLPPSTAHRMLNILSAEGMVERSDRGSYGVGVEFRRLAQQVLDQDRVEDLARPVLARVVADTNESCALGLYRPQDRTVAFTTVLESTHPLTYRVPLNVAAPVFLGASGRSIMAFLPEAEIAAALEDVPRSAERPSRETVLASLDEIRDQGYVVTHGEKLEGAVGIAAPIFGGSQRVVGCLCITIPEFRFEPDRQDDLGALLVREAERLSVSLGASPRAGASSAR